jgi:hypothetical protein
MVMTLLIVRPFNYEKYMSSQGVKNWRIRTKTRIVNAMGGECVLCGYSKCHAALELHHINPTEKDFALGSIRANSISWEKIVAELRKCVMLCANCHREVEAGVVELPPEPRMFDEAYAEYKEVTVHQYNCTGCGCEFAVGHKLKRKAIPYCSPQCAAQSRRKVKDRPTKEVLTELLKTHSYLRLGKMYGVSDNAVRKWVKAYGIV